MKKESIQTKKLVQLALLTGIELIFCFTILGSLPVGPIVATLSHIPVIVAAIVLGRGAGMYMGALFGLCSFLVNSFYSPTITSFVFTPVYSLGTVQGNFWSIVICFVPRILLGLFAALIFEALMKATHGKSVVSAAVAGVSASVVHTVLVLGGIYVFFGRDYAQVIGESFDVLLKLIMSVVLTNGLPEAAIAGIIAAVLVVPLRRLI